MYRFSSVLTIWRKKIRRLGVSPFFKHGLRRQHEKTQLQGGDLLHQDRAGRPDEESPQGGSVPGGLLHLIACIGLFSLIDGVLADVSEQATTKFKSRLDIVKRKIGSEKSSVG